MPHCCLFHECELNSFGGYPQSRLYTPGTHCLLTLDMIVLHCIRVNMNKTKVLISGEHQKPVQKAARWSCGV